MAIYALNQPRKGMYLSDFLAVTDVYLGKTQPNMRMSSSLCGRSALRTLCVQQSTCASAIDIRLMVSHKHHWSLLQRILSTDTAIALDAPRHPKGRACGEPHAPLEGPRNGPLRQATVADKPQHNTSDDAIGCAGHHDEEGRDEEGVVLEELCGSPWEHTREGAHGDDKDSWRGCEVEKPAHGKRSRLFEPRCAWRRWNRIRIRQW
ncbi:hypothetical protein IAQ61_004864 [Plenodomus lingam]|uniref:uncharacterized protein n=1 Tax=Leptosphaeria maculans TaxID=5022 RepID=UPI003320C431|nr:hypothetical protein IAQ61_004864 [Plenodomus lingam]